MKRTARFVAAAALVWLAVSRPAVAETRGLTAEDYYAFETLTDPHEPLRASRDLTDGWFFDVLPDLNTENPLVAQYLQQNAIWWAESSVCSANAWAAACA